MIGSFLVYLFTHTASFIIDQWTYSDSNRDPSACKAAALPVGATGPGAALIAGGSVHQASDRVRGNPVRVAGIKPHSSRYSPRRAILTLHPQAVPLGIEPSTRRASTDCSTNELENRVRRCGQRSPPHIHRSIRRHTPAEGRGIEPRTLYVPLVFKTLN